MDNNVVFRARESSELDFEADTYADNLFHSCQTQAYEHRSNLGYSTSS